MTTILILCFCNVTILAVLMKWKIIERYEVYRFEWLPTWCELCFFFWCGMVEYTIINFHRIVGWQTLLSTTSHALAIVSISQLILRLKELIHAFIKNNSGEHY